MGIGSTMDQTNMTKNQIRSVLESLLFLSGKPMPLERLMEIIPEVAKEEIEEALAEIKTERSSESFGVELTEVGGGYQLRTKAENSPFIFKLNKARPVRLSRAALETLSIVAYRQPLT